MLKTSKLLMGFAVLLLALALVANSSVIAKTSYKASTRSLAKASELVHEEFDGNSIACWMENVGLIVSHRVTGSSGMEWPKGSNKTIDYASGLWMFGKNADGEILSASSEYSSEFQPGSILSNGQAGNPDDAAYRIYKINSDGTGDWDVWPYDQGAPWTLDGNGNKIPKITGDQTLFWVQNDMELANHGNFMSTNPMGVEQQITVFGYNLSNPLGNIMFIQWKTINKSSVNYDSVFVAVWDDPDLGDASDDLVGCDTTLSLGFCYNGQPVDATYGTTPPALGFDFFQGPMVDGVPLPMTSFVYYWNGAPDPYGDPEDATQGFNFMKGFASDGSDYVDNNNVATRFCFAGDPVSGSGWNDDHFDDRRFLMSSGPFILAAGDTQVVVGAKIIAPGTDNLAAVSALRFFDSFAQTAFDNNFDLPVPPPPVTEVINLDGKVVLEWQDENEKYKTTEAYDFKGYTFEGYNVYKGESSSGPWTRLHTFDVVNDVGIIFDNDYDAETGMVLNKPASFGANTGLTRNIAITEEAGGVPLKNFKTYYFAVTTYAVNPDISPKVIESGLAPLTAVPSGPTLGIEHNAEEGVVVAADHLSGISDGTVNAVIVDPGELQDVVYQVNFEETEEGYVWHLSDKNTGQKLLENQTNQSGDEDYQIIDGMKLKVAGPPLAIKTWDYEGSRWISGTNWGASALFGGMDLGINFFGSEIAPAQYVPILLEWQDQAGVDANGYVSKGAYYHRPGYAHQGTMQYPFAAYDTSDPANPRRVNVCFTEAADNSNAIFDMGWDGSAFAASGNREYIFIMLSDYDEGASYDDNNWGPAADVLYAIWPGARGSHPNLEAEFTLTVEPNFVNTADDVFEFTTPIASVGTAVARKQMEDINAVPNPYFGYNPAEREPTTRIMRFTNLPGSGATLRIFDLAGNLVKVIDEDLRSTQGSLNTTYAEWDLRNASDVPVASGVYLVYIDVPNVGSKVLKVAIINRSERLLYF